MLHTKFQGHWSIGFGEEDFLRFLPYMGIVKVKDNFKEWTGMDFASSTRAAENRSGWKGIVANSSVVP